MLTNPHQVHLVFRLSDEEARMRFRQIQRAFSGDPNVADVRVLETSAEPDTFWLVLHFRPPATQPANASLQHLVRILQAIPKQPANRWELLFEDATY